MKNLNIFSNTILDEISNFEGELVPIVLSRNQFLLFEREIDEMKDVEKTIFSLWARKHQEKFELLCKITGKDLGRMDYGDLEEIVIGFVTETDFINKKKLDSLQREVNLLYSLLWDLIRLRFGEEITLDLRPGYKIVTGVDPNTMIENHIISGKNTYVN